MSLKQFACMMVSVFLLPGILLSQQREGPRLPISWEINVGGMGPMGKASNTYSSSFLVGGGMSIPITRWFSADIVNMDFGFGTSKDTQTLSVSDGSNRNTKNYQMMFSSGGRVNVPLGGGAALGLGGGYGNVGQYEYVPTRSFYQNGVLVYENIDCGPCSQKTFQGPYLQARLFGRATKYNGFGVSAKYFIARDTDKGYFSRPPQRWLTVSLTFSFGI